jgi:hypothetical protein
MSDRIRRVVVRLDAAADSRNAIATAARLAARAGAPLHGIFVEDEEVLHLAALPFARQVSPGTGSERLTVAMAELHQRSAAERARAELSATAGQHDVELSFEVVRATSGIALAGAAEVDLVVAGALNRPIAGQFRVSCRWWSSIEDARAPVLLVHHAWSGGAVAAVLRDRGESAARLLRTAARLARISESSLIIIGPPALARSRAFGEWIAEHLGDPPIPVQIEPAPSNPATLPELLAGRDCHLLAIEPRQTEGSSNRLREFVERFSCNLLIAA